MHNGKSNFKYLTEEPIARVVLTMAVPTIISMLVTSIYNIVDTYFVSQLSTQATAAVGIVFSLMFFVQSFGFFFGHGSGNYISRELGSKHRAKAVIMASTGFYYSFFFGLSIAIIAYFFKGQLALLLGSTPTILPYTKKYLGMISFGFPFLTSSLTLNNQMRLQGNASYAMWGILVGAILNIVLDPLFIFYFDLGIEGAALATLIGQITSFGILFFMARQGENIGIYFRNFRLSWHALLEIFYGGSPSLLRQGLACVATMSLNISAGVFGDEAIAAMSIVSRVSMLVLATVVGLCQGFQPLCGFCYGAGLYKRLKRAFEFTVKTGTIFLIMCMLLAFIFSENIIRMFRNDSQVIAIGVVALRYQLLTYPLNAFLISSNMMLQTCRKPWRANFLAAARQGLFFIPLIIALPSLFGLLGVEACQAVSDILSFTVTLPIIIFTYREFNKKKFLNLQR